MGDRDSLVIDKNLKFLRKRKGLTQQELANHLGVRRASIGAYEEGRATPRYETLERVSDFFQVSIDLLIKENLSELSEEDFEDFQNAKAMMDAEGRRLRILPITVDHLGRENIEFVPQKASAGYLNGYADPEYIEELPKFQLPMLGSGTFRAFEIKGDSMLPLKPGTVVIGEYVQDWTEARDGQPYIVVSSTEGVVFKRIFNRKAPDGSQLLTLKSDNPAYPPYEVRIEDVREIWKAKMFLSQEFPDPEISLEKLSSIVLDLQQEVIRMKRPGNN